MYYGNKHHHKKRSYSALDPHAQNPFHIHDSTLLPLGKEGLYNPEKLGFFDHVPYQAGDVRERKGKDGTDFVFSLTAEKATIEKLFPKDSAIGQQGKFREHKNGTVTFIAHAPSREEVEKIRQAATPQLENTRPALDRSKFYKELQDPAVWKAFAHRIHTEVGTQGYEAQIAFAETIFNRADARGMTLMQTLRGNYFPKSQRFPGQMVDANYFAVISRVYNEGTDISHGATGNACLNVRFGHGKTLAKFGSELFGAENNEKDNRWRNNMPLRRGPSPH